MCDCRRMDCVPCNRFRVLSCWRKRTHRSPAEAIRAASGDPLLTAYRCVFCGGYHVGHVRRAARDDPEKLPRRNRQKEEPHARR